MFVNLAVRDLNRSKQFFSKLGFGFDPRFTDDNAACMVISAEAYVMLLTAPFSEKGAQHFHWHVEIMPKLTRVAGFEIGSGFYINPTPPEDAAQYPREIAVEI